MSAQREKTPFLRGIGDAVPVTLGYFPVAFAFGVLATKGGLAPWAIGLMGTLVFAGSGQLIAASMLISGATISSIILMTFIVNLRHLLMAASLSRYVQHWPIRLQAFFAFQLTDETFAINANRFATTVKQRLSCNTRDIKTACLTFNCMAHLSWISGGIVGAVAGSAISDIKPFGLDYALPAMFVALLVPHCYFPRRLVAAIMAAVFSLFIALYINPQWNVLLATALAATIAVFIPNSLLGNKADADESMHSDATCTEVKK